MKSKQIYALIRKRATIVIVLGAMLFLVMGFLLFGCVLSLLDGQYESSDVNVTIFMTCNTLVGLAILIFGILYANPKTCYACRRNPDLFAQVDELYANTIYKDENIICSERNIGDINNILCVAAFREILGIYEQPYNDKYSKTFNQMTRSQDLMLVTVKGNVSLKLYYGLDERINTIKQIVAEHAPEARVNATPEDMAYFRQMQKQYAKEKKLR